MFQRYVKEKIADLFNGPTLSQLATVDENGRPWVRYAMSSMDDRATIRIPTRRETRKVAHIAGSPFVHLLVGRNLFSRYGEYAQICGRAVVVDDPRRRRDQWNPSMRSFFEGPNDPAYVLVEIRPYRMEYWSAQAAANENPLVLEEDDLVEANDEFGRLWVGEDRLETQPV